jgi:two-component system cell cycle response regulator
MEHILIVNSNPQTRTMLQSNLTKAGYGISVAEKGEIALEKIKNDLPDVVLLEASMPDMTGFQICQRLLDVPQSDLVYIIMLSTGPKDELKARGLDKGPDEYVADLFDTQKLLTRIRAGLDTISAKRNAVIDPLTKLYNQNFFSTYLAQEVTKAKRYQYHIALIMGEIDHFKRINETSGEQGGDAVLVEIGRILRRSCRRSDIPVRWDGEEFVILFHETELIDGMMIAERIRETIESYEFEGVGHLTASFGVATLTTNRHELIKRAMLGLDQAKKGGGNKVVFMNK